MSKIMPEHLTRQAVVYIRQSTADQVANNLESKRRQYGLADRTRLPTSLLPYSSTAIALISIR